MKATVEPFTKEHYPNGYSRKDCQESIRNTERELDAAKRNVKRLTGELASLHKELKQGGRLQ